jgi:hypothetical protein
MNPATSSDVVVLAVASLLVDPFASISLDIAESL